MMPSVISFEIGSHAFKDREIDHAAAVQLINRVLTNFGTSAGAEVVLTENIVLLAVNGIPCEYPPSLAEQVAAYVNRINAQPAGELFWELLITQLLWLQPNRLVTDGMITEYMPALLELSSGRQSAFLPSCQKIVTELFSLKMAPIDKEPLKRISTTYLSWPDPDWNELREELIDAYAVDEIPIHINKAYFYRLMRSPAKLDVFEMMRDGMYYETGIAYPPFRFMLSEELPEDSFCFQSNSFVSIPLKGLPAENYLLANGSPEQLGLLGMTGTGSTHPVTGLPATIMAASDQKKAEEAGYTTWDALGYFILCFSSYLRKNGWIYLNRKSVVNQLQSLKLFYPAIIELLEKARLVALCTKVLRLLAREGLSVRNLRLILEAMLEADCIVADGQKLIIFDERIPVQQQEISDWKMEAENSVEFVRGRLKRSISQQYTKGQSSLMVYILDAAIEETINPKHSPSNRPDAAWIKKFVDAVWNEVDSLPSSAQQPVVLTNINVRPHVKSLLEKRMPDLAVLSYQDLSPELNIQPLAKITLDQAGLP
ncbi:MAG: FHIPEP family type III secretion protein [Williamsia sp.]|nr:FHIPEP family type III secretion protein [Williamsia sp.]